MSVAFADHSGPWTIADVEALPEPNDGSRFELLSTGVLTVSPTPGFRHQRGSRRLANILETAATAAGVDVEIFETVYVEFPGERLAEPDIAVVDRTFAATDPVRCPASVVQMIVEIVSPGSGPQDRLLKPHLYAEGGIPVYWRLEQKPQPHLLVFELRRGQYVQVTSAPGGSKTRIDLPFPVEIDPLELVRQ